MANEPVYEPDVPELPPPDSVWIRLAEMRQQRDALLATLRIVERERDIAVQTLRHLREELVDADLWWERWVHSALATLDQALAIDDDVEGEGA